MSPLPTTLGTITRVQNLRVSSGRGELIGTVELTVNLDTLMRWLGERALTNKGRRSRSTGVVAKAHSVHLAAEEVQS